MDDHSYALYEACCDERDQLAAEIQRLRGLLYDLEHEVVPPELAQEWVIRVKGAAHAILTQEAEWRGHANPTRRSE